MTAKIITLPGRDTPRRTTTRAWLLADHLMQITARLARCERLADYPGGTNGLLHDMTDELENVIVAVRIEAGERL